MKWIVNVDPSFFEDWWRLHNFQENLVTAKALSADLHILSPGKSEVGLETEIPFSPLGQVLERWRLPVHFMWPVACKTDGFIERAAQGLWKRFDDFEAKNDGKIGNILVFSPHSSLKKLASNLRGRLLQLSEERLKKNTSGGFLQWRNDILKMPPEQIALQICLDSKGIYAGATSPKFSGHFFAGGQRFVSQKAEDFVSRAGAKFVEAQEQFLLYGKDLSACKTWLELGAAPGGMTSELLKRDFEVWALDRAALEKRISDNSKVHFWQGDIQFYQHKASQIDAILCDMNGPAHLAVESVIRLKQHLKNAGPVIFTLKLQDKKALVELIQFAKMQFEKNGFSVIKMTHLYHNRSELTILLLKNE